MRNVIYLTGTRADYGLMRRTLKMLHSDRRFHLEVAVTGMHLLPEYGMTLQEILDDGFSVAGRINAPDSSGSSAQMALNIAAVIEGMTDIILRKKPDILLLLGDRGEMLSGAIAAIHLNTAVVHLHGGERSGTVDEPVRHAISKLSNYHLVSTNDARERLIRMGEPRDHVWTVGAPGLDGLLDDAAMTREQLLASLGLDRSRPVALLVHHPVHHDQNLMVVETNTILESLFRCNCQVVAVGPNSDAGSKDILNVLKVTTSSPDLHLVTHFHRTLFVSWMSAVDLMIGNSSAGIIEAASFGTPVINIGSRQNLRDRNSNVTDVAQADEGLTQIIQKVLAVGRIQTNNVYGDGSTAPRIVERLATIPLTSQSLRKSNAY